MSADIFMPIIYLICLLILIGPRFLETNSSFKQLSKKLKLKKDEFSYMAHGQTRKI